MKVTTVKKKKLNQIQILQKKVIISETPVCDIRSAAECGRETLYFYFFFLVTW